MEKTKRNPFVLLSDAGYSKKATFLLSQQLNFGIPENPDSTAKHQSDCGDRLILYLKLNGQTISNATYEYVGCRGLEAAVSTLTEMIKGKTLHEAMEIDFQDLLTFLEGIPPSKDKCIQLVHNTLKRGMKEQDLRSGIKVAKRDLFFSFTKGRILSLDY